MNIVRAQIHKLADECCALGEGPHYDPADDTAWWLDITGCRLIEHRFAADRTQVHDLPCIGSLVVPIDKRRQLIVLEDGLYVRNKTSGELTLLQPLEADNKVTRSNDGRVHPSGSLWIGTMGKRAESEAGTIYWSDGVELHRLFEKISIPNSICFSPDGTLGYFADSTVNRVWRVDLDPGTGLPTSEPEIFLTANDLPLGGVFDGSITDADGVLWNAAWGGGSISGFRPDGALLKTFELPAARVTCPCFVGTHLDQLLVTSAWEGYDDKDRTADPGTGFTYVIKGGFNGRADAKFRLPGE